MPASPPISREAVEQLRESWKFYAEFYEAKEAGERAPAGMARMFMWDLTKLLEGRT